MASAISGNAGQAAAPHDLDARTEGSHVFVTWRAAGLTPPDAFVLEAGTAPGLADLAIVNIPWGADRGLDASFAAAGVAPGVYFVRVRERHGSFVGSPSEDIEMRVGDATCPLPYAPRNVAAEIAGTQVTLAWSPPPTGADGLGYVIEAGSQPGAPNIAIVHLTDLTRFSVQAPPGRYYVRMRTIGRCGASEPSPEVVVVVP